MPLIKKLLRLSEGYRVPMWKSGALKVVGGGSIIDYFSEIAGVSVDDLDIMRELEGGRLFTEINVILMLM